MSRYFGRCYKLTLIPPGGSGKKVWEVRESTTPMDIKFDISYARGQIAREGTVSILGLSHKTIYDFICLAGLTRGYAMSKLARVKLEVGYASSAGMIEVIDGFAWHASASSPPNMWIHIKVSECNASGGQSIAPGLDGEMTLKTMATSMMKKFSVAEGVKFSVQDCTQDKILDKQHEDEIKVRADFGEEDIDLKTAIQKLNAVSKDIQFILKKSRSEGDTRVLEAIDKAVNKAYKANIRVDKNTGLLSVTGIDAINGCITTFIDGAVDDHFSHLVLSSEMNPQANGTYYITRRQFIGHFNGPEWYARYYCSDRQGS